MPRRPLTTPPRALPLVGLGFVAMFVASCAFNAVAALAFAASMAVHGGSDLLGDGLPQDGARLLLAVDLVLLLFTVNVAVLIGAMALMRVLVARWVVAQAPEPF